MLNDNYIHRYSFRDGKIYFTVINPNGVIEKNIRLCNNVDNCEFIFAENSIKVLTNLGGMIRTDNYGLKLQNTQGD